jgi:hypothetical protein
MHHHCTPVLAALALCGAVQAQRLAAYVPPLGPGVIAEIQPPVPILPAPAGPIVIYPQVPPLPVLAPPAGDSTFDNALGFHWVTNGAVLAPQPTPTFPALGPVPAGFAIPGPVLAAIGGGPVTGIALDAAAGILWLTGAPGVTIGCAPVPAMPVLVAPFPLAFPFQGPITGLEWDAIAGTLIACNAAGVCYRYFPGGAGRSADRAGHPAARPGE